MNFGEWTAKLVEVLGTSGIDLWLFRMTSAGRQVITHDGMLKTLKQDEAVDNNDYFARFEDTEQLHAIANAFAKFGIKTNNDHKNEGLLEATKFHLEDMRKIVFSKYPKET